MKLCSLVTLLVATSSLAHAGIIRVGPGLIPTTIQPAVDAAVDGDVILVETGIYPSFVIRNKELTVVANTNADVRINGAVRVGNLASTRTVVLSGLKNVGNLASLTNPEWQYGLRVAKCAGLVLAQSCDFIGAGLTGTTPSARSSLLVENSARVVLANCSVTGIGGQADGYGYTGAPGFTGACVLSSSVALYETQVRGGHGGVGDIHGLNGGDGLVAISSQMFASAGTFVGGHGGNGNDSGDSDGANGGIGASLTATSFFGIGVSFSGGAAGLAGFCWAEPGDPLPQSCPHAGLPGAPTSGGGISGFAGSARKLSAPALVREQQNAVLVFNGTAGDTLVRMSSRHGSTQFIPGSGTQVPVQDASFRRPTLGVLGGSGTFTQTIPIDELGAGVDTRVIFFQAAHVESGTVVRLGTPRAVIMLDSAF